MNNMPIYEALAQRGNALEIGRHHVGGAFEVVLSLDAHPKRCGRAEYRASRSAVSAVIGVSPRTSRSMRVRGTPHAAATA
jgi:hypothetical protein